MREVFAGIAVCSWISAIGVLFTLGLKGELENSIETAIAFAAVSVVTTLLLRSDRDR